MNDEDLKELSNDVLAALAMSLLERCEPDGVFLSTPLDETEVINDIAQLSKFEAVILAGQVIELLRLRLQIEEPMIVGDWQSSSDDEWVYELMAS